MPRQAQWLSVIGIGEDGLSGLSAASLAALQEAEAVFGGARHLELAQAGARGRPWSVPFDIAPVMEMRGQRVAVLASGDPFWHGVGGTLARQLEPTEWRVYPGPSSFSLIAARMGWRLEETVCLGLHAAPVERLLPNLADDVQAICLLRDGVAVQPFLAWLADRGFGASPASVFVAVGGPREQRCDGSAEALLSRDFDAPVAVAVALKGRTSADGFQRSSGLPDDAFHHDGQITKRPVRALTLSALAPRRGEMLWDIGAGSGSISVEWLLSAGRNARAIAIEPRRDRIETIRANAAAFGFSDRLMIVEGTAPDALTDLPEPQAVFVGGGASEELLSALWSRLPAGSRLVANAVTLESEALLGRWAAEKGGSLMHIAIAEASALGTRRGWSPARPIVQWSVVV